MDQKLVMVFRRAEEVLVTMSRHILGVFVTVSCHALVMEFSPSSISTLLS